MALFSLGVIYAQQESSENSNLAVDESTILLNPSSQGESTEVDNTATPTVALGIGDYLRMLFGLGVVALLIFLFSKWIKKVTPGGEVATALIKTVASRNLSRDNSLHIIDLEGKIFLLGSSSNGGVSKIAEIEEKEIIDKILLKAGESKAEGSFLDLVKKTLSFDAPSNKGSEAESEDNLDFLKKQRERAEKL